MVRVPALWVQNTDKDSPVVLYSSSTVTYNSATTRYSGVDVTLDSFDKLPADWTLQPKSSPIAWQNNAAYNDAAYAYDSASRLYDSASRTYDGVTAGEYSTSTKTPTAWEAA